MWRSAARTHAYPHRQYFCCGLMIRFAFWHMWHILQMQTLKREWNTCMMYMWPAADQISINFQVYICRELCAWRRKNRRGSKISRWCDTCVGGCGCSDLLIWAPEWKARHSATRAHCARLLCGNKKYQLLKVWSCQSLLEILCQYSDKFYFVAQLAKRGTKTHWWKLVRREIQVM